MVCLRSGEIDDRAAVSGDKECPRTRAVMQSLERLSLAQEGDKSKVTAAKRMMMNLEADLLGVWCLLRVKSV